MRFYYPHSAQERLDENLKALKAQVDLKLSADKATVASEGKLLNGYFFIPYSPHWEHGIEYSVFVLLIRQILSIFVKKIFQQMEEKKRQMTTQKH